MLPGSIEYTPNQMAWLREREPGGQKGAHAGSSCFLSLWHWGLKGTRHHWLNGRQQKWDKKNEQRRKAPVLTNDVPPQRLYSTSGPLQVHFFARFCGMTPRSLCIIEWITKHWKPFSLVSAVDKCSMRSVGYIGNSMQLNLWYQSVLEINQAYSIYPKPNLSMSRPKKENKIYLFSDRHHFL